MEDRTFTIRRAGLGEEDAQAAIFIENSCFEHPWSEDGVRESINNEHTLFLFAEADGEPAGSISAWLIPPFECQILNLAVLPQYRRMGAARALLSAMEEEASKLGIDDSTLEVRVSNSAAIALYESCGYTAAGIRKNYYENSEDAIIMWKRGFGLQR